jgi:hypothetical protein
MSYLADFTKGPQYFTISMNIFELSNEGRGMFKRTKVPLEPCTRAHWEIDPQFLSVYDYLGADRWLCVPIGFPLPMQGALVSTVSTQMSI